MTSPEAWLRGPVEGVPAVLQPIAHALLQAREESRRLLENFPAELLWTRPAGIASVGFHLQHITGVVDRLFTYARGESPSTPQQETLAREGHQPGTGGALAGLNGGCHDSSAREGLWLSGRQHESSGARPCCGSAFLQNRARIPRDIAQRHAAQVGRSRSR